MLGLFCFFRKTTLQNVGFVWHLSFVCKATPTRKMNDLHVKKKATKQATKLMLVFVNGNNHINGA